MRIFVHKERCEKDEKIGHKILMSSYVFFLLRGRPQINVMEYFLCIGPAKYLRASSPTRKMSLFPSITISHVRLFDPIR